MPAVRVKLRELQDILKGDSTPSEVTENLGDKGSEEIMSMLSFTVRRVRVKS